MLQLPKTSKGLAYLYLLMLLPVMANQFSLLLVKGRGSWLVEYDPWLFAAYQLMIVLFFVFWLIEGRKRILSNHLPYWMLTVTLAVLAIELLLGYVRPISLSMQTLFSLLQRIIAWGVILVIVVVIPVWVFARRMGAKEKVLSILMAGIFILFQAVPLAATSPRLYMLVMRALHGYSSSLMVWLLVFYFLLAYVLNNDFGRKGGGVWFIVTSLGLATTVYGMMNPVEYQSRGWYKTDILVNGIKRGTGITQLIDMNIWVIVGAGLLVLMLIVYLSTKKDEALK